MFTRKLFMVWTGIFLLSSLFLLGQESWQISFPRILEYSNSGCLPEPMVPALEDQYPFCGDDWIGRSVQGSTLQISHYNATYNCCPTDISVRLVVAGNLLRLIEDEIMFGMPCPCLCCYDVTTIVGDLLPGTYEVEYCWDDRETGDECRRFTVQIE